MHTKPLIGVGLRHTHFPYLLENPKTEIDFFEAISENFLSTAGRPLNVLLKLRETYPIALHGVSMSIASKDALDKNYLKKLKDLYLKVEPFITSDHLCWTGHNSHNLHNLLPFSYREEELKFVSEKINFVQDFLGRQMLFENLSAYFTLNDSEMTELEFMNELCDRTGASILFDINNLFVNSFNQGFDALTEINKLNFKHVKQIHLAGFSDMGDYLFDTHSKEVSAEVWKLVKYFKSSLHGIPTMIEWDEDIPTFEKLEAEAMKARGVIYNEL